MGGPLVFVGHGCRPSCPLGTQSNSLDRIATVNNSPRRPAHRPSRRSSVIDAAIGLFATYPAEAITVADIAAAANMTAAAVYYHFPSKEAVLLEGLQSFTRDYLIEVRRLTRETDDPGWVSVLVTESMEWLEEHRLGATVFFARSSGLDMTIEALRRETRIEQVNIFTRAIRSGARRRLAADVGVMAVGLVSSSRRRRPAGSRRTRCSAASGGLASWPTPRRWPSGSSVRLSLRRSGRPWSQTPLLICDPFVTQ